MCQRDAALTGLVPFVRKRTTTTSPDHRRVYCTCETQRKKVILGKNFSWREETVIRHLDNASYDFLKNLLAYRGSRTRELLSRYWDDRLKTSAATCVQIGIELIESPA